MDTNSSRTYKVFFWDRCLLSCGAGPYARQYLQCIYGFNIICALGSMCVRDIGPGFREDDRRHLKA